MAKGRRLVTQHLEQVSGRVLDEYAEVVRELIRGRSGVYALYRRGTLYYVGLASNLMGRLKTHQKDRHNGRWDRFSVYLTVRDEHMKELESIILRIVEPKGNRVAGKFARSEDIRRELNRRMRDHDADRRADLLGGHVARRRHRTKIKHGLGANRLAGIAGRAMRLQRHYKGGILKASLLKDGRIRVAGELYDSPNAAARAATGRKQINGWSFWHFRNEKKEWVPLRSLRG